MELYRILVGLIFGILIPSQLFWLTDQLVLDDSLLLKFPKVELKDIGYNGSWEEFCDTLSIERDFTYYPQHEVKLLRFLICQRRDFNEIDCDKLATFAAYKYCTTIRPLVDEFLEGLLSRFSLEDQEKRDELMDLGPVDDETICFTRAKQHFNETCIDKKNPCHRMYHLILARACTARWLTPDSVISHITDVCSSRRIDGTIDWVALTKSIRCRG